MNRGGDIEKDGQQASKLNASQAALHRDYGQLPAKPRRRRRLLLVLAPLVLYFLSTNLLLQLHQRRSPQQIHYLYSPEVIDHCRALNVKPTPPNDFYTRKQSDRFAPGTSATLIKNATIWTGRDNGKDVFQGDVLLDGGIIRWIGQDSTSAVELEGLDVDILDAKGRWLTPGFAFLTFCAEISGLLLSYSVVDLHSHLAVGSAPALRGAQDDNSIKTPAQPWLRSVDAINTHDDGFRLAIAGGVTTSLILPGSADAIGDSFVIQNNYMN